MDNFVLSKNIHISEVVDTADQKKYFFLFAWYYVRSEQLIFNFYHVIRLEVMALCEISMSKKEMNNKSLLEEIKVHIQHLKLFCYVCHNMIMFYS